MKTIDFSYFIERYIAGEMNEAEKQWFIKELDGNSGLREEVTLRERTDLVLKRHDIISLRNKLSEIEKNRRSRIPSKTTGKRLPISIAAAITGLIIISSIAFFGTGHLTNDEIINQYYKSYEGVSTSRSSHEATSNDYSTGLEYYNIHDYKNAALYFSKVLNVDPENIESTMFFGTSSFEVNNFPDAQRSFKKVIDNNNNLFMEDAEWYLALCYVRTNDIKRASAELKAIKNSKSIYSKNASKILRQINK
jgi:tetratricopeptide (TPR) repeat protein